MAAILKNKYLLISVASLLLVFNYLKWTGGDLRPTPKKAVTKKNIEFADLKLTTNITDDTKIEIHRDLFHPPKVKKAKPKKIVKAKPKPKPKPKGPPPLTAEQIAHNKAKLQLAQVKVMGIMEQGGLQQAFIVYNEDTFIVKKGEKFADVFQLSNIRAGEIDVMELKTALSKIIQLNK